MSYNVMDAIEFVGVTNLFVAVTVSLIVFWFIRENSTTSRLNMPPGPPAIPYPFDGLMALFPTKNQFGRLVALCRRYGDLVTIRIGRNRMVFVSSPAIVKDLLVKQADTTSNRKIPPFFKYSIRYTGGIVFSHGELWQEMRRFTLLALRSFGMGKRSIERRINDEARIFCETLSQFAVRAIPLDPIDRVNAAVSNVINSITFGKRFDYDDPVFKDMLDRLRAMTRASNTSDVVNRLTRVFPVLLKSPLVRRGRLRLRGLKDSLLGELKEHVKTYDANDMRDVIDMYLSEARRLEATSEKPILTRDNIWMFVFDLFVAGTETTSSVLLWFLLLMADHPDIQTKVTDEIDQVIGRERAPSVDDRINMPYTEATLSEVMRFRPILPFAVPHVAASDINIQGYTIPKNTDIMLNVLGMHLDPRLWDDPEVFNPQHFLSEDGKDVIKPEAFFVFGTGRRVCLGEQLARMELFIFATSLLQRFSFRLPDGVAADYGYEHCKGLLLPKKYHVMLKER